METLEELCNTIRARRRALGLTQDALARAAGLSQKTVSQIESGEGANPAYTNLWTIIRALEETERERLGRRREDTAGDIMAEVKGFQTTDKAKRACILLRRNLFSQAPVFKGTDMVGALHYADLFNAGSELDKKTVEDYMRTPLPAISAKTPLEDALHILQKFKAVTVTVNGRIKGIITEDDLFRKS